MKHMGKAILPALIAVFGCLAAAPAALAEGVEPVTATISSDYDYIDVSESRWVYYTSPRITIDSEGYDALEEAVAAYSDQSQDYAKASIEEYAEWAKSEGDDGGTDFMSYYLDSEIKVRRSDSVVFSFNNLESSYTGGAHPNSWYSPKTFDSATGKELGLADVLNDTEGLPELLQEVLLQKYDADSFLSEDLAESIRTEMNAAGTYLDFVTGEEMPVESGPAFTLEPESITFWFSPYELTSFAMGGISVTLYFEDYPDLVKEEYQQAADSWFLPLEDGEEVRLPGSGAVMSVSARTEDEYGMDWVITTTVNGVSKEETEWGFDFDHYLLYTGGKDFLISEVSGEDNYSQMRITDLSGAAYVSSGSHIPDAHIFARHFNSACPTNPEYCVLNHSVDLLSTYTVGRAFRFTEDGVPEPLEPWDHIYDRSNEYFEMALTTKRSLEVTVVDEGGEVTGNTELPAGTKLHFLRTDGERWVDMTDAEGTIYRLFVEGIWPQQVNGLNADDVFDGIMFAG